LGDDFSRELLDVVGAEPSRELETLANLPIDLIMTMSVGTEWERALAASGKLINSVVPGQSPDYDYDAVVYHLCGRGDIPGSLSFSRPHSEMQALLEAWWSSRVFLFVGFSTEDDELELVLERMMPTGSQQHFIFLPDATIIEESELAEQYNLNVLPGVFSAQALVPLLHGGAGLMAQERVDLDSLLARAHGDYERLIDVNVARLSLAEQEVERRQILLETAALLEDKMGDRQRAFEATLSAYRELPDKELWGTLSRRSETVDEKRRLAESVFELRSTLPKAARVPALLEAVRVYREVGDIEHATELIELTSADKAEYPELAAVHLELLREGERWHDLARLLHDAADKADYLEEREAHLVARAELLHKKLDEPWAAIEGYQQILQLNPGNGVALAALESLFLDLHQVPALLELLGDFGTRYRAPELAAKLWRIGERCRSRGDLAGAVLCFERLRDEQPSNEKLLSGLAELYDQQGETARHRDVLKAQVGASAPGKNRAELCEKLARVHEELHELDAAAECWEWVLLDNPASDAAFRALDRVYRVSRRWPELLELYSRRLEQVDGDELRHLLLETADIYQYQLEDCGRAIDYCLRAIELEKSAELESRLLTLYTGAARYQDAAELADEQARADRESPRHALQVKEAAELWLKAGDTVKAVRRMKRALKERPHSPEFHIALGRAFEQAKQYLEAGNAYENAARYSEASRATKHALSAASCFEEVGATERAIAVLEARMDGGASDSALIQELRHLYERSSRHSELAELLRTLVVGAEAEERLELLWTIAECHRALGQWEEEIECCEEAVELFPERISVVRRMAETAVQHQSWDAVEHSCRILLTLETRPEEIAEIYCMLARREAALDNTEAALKLLGKARDKVPFDRGALMLLTELSEEQPEAQTGYLRALLLDAEDDEKADLLIQLGDIYAKRLDLRADARDAYQQALLLREGDHLLLHRCLEFSVEDGDWYESLEYLERLIDTEKDAAVRSRYLSTAARVHEEELQNVEPAIPLLWRAADDNPADRDVLERLMSHLRDRKEWHALLEATSRLLAVLRDDPSVTPAEHARAWSSLAEICVRELNDRETAVCSLEVAVNLQPYNLNYRNELARLYTQEESRLDDAVEQMQAILDLEPERQHSYRMLERLYEKLGQEDSAAACRLASAYMRGETREPVERATNLNAQLTLERYGQLVHPDDRLALGQLMALLTPVIAAVAPRRKRRSSSISQWKPLPATHLVVARIKRLAKSLGVYPPVVYHDEDAAVPVQMITQNVDGELVPAIVLSGELLEEVESAQSTFLLASALASARREYIALLIEPDTQVLAQSLDAVVEVAREGEASSKTARAFAKHLSPVVLDQIRSLLAKLPLESKSSVDLMRSWFEASARTADRIALWVTGDLAAALKGLEQRGLSEDKDVTARQDLIRAHCCDGMRDEISVVRPTSPLRTLVKSAKSDAIGGSKNMNPKAMRDRFRMAAQTVTEELQLDQLLNV
jgi:tetratricopeptide (TPR) repeat protein